LIHLDLFGPTKTKSIRAKDMIKSSLMISPDGHD